MISAQLTHTVLMKGGDYRIQFILEQITLFIANVTWFYKTRNIVNSVINDNPGLTLNPRKCIVHFLRLKDCVRVFGPTNHFNNLKGDNMGLLRKHYEKMTPEQLRAERFEIEKKVEENDGRLTTDSSADLDYNLDKLDIIDEIFADWVEDTLTSDI